MKKEIKAEKDNMITLSDYTNQKTNPYLIKSFSNHIPSEMEMRNELRDKLTKGVITEDLYSKAIEQLDGLMMKAKSGEGSRGGHIIGHTKSGKPVYSGKKAEHKDYKEFTSQDHKDAASLHGEKAEGHQGSINSTAQEHAKNQLATLAQHHREMVVDHMKQSGDMAQKEHAASLSVDEKKIIADQKKNQINHHSRMADFHDSMLKHLNDYASKHSTEHGSTATINAIQDQRIHHSSHRNHHASEKERIEKPENSNKALRRDPDYYHPSQEV